MRNRFQILVVFAVSLVVTVVMLASSCRSDGETYVGIEDVDQNDIIGVWRIEDPSYYLIGDNEQKSGWKATRLEFEKDGSFRIVNLNREMRETYSPIVLSEKEIFTGKWAIETLEHQVNNERVKLSVIILDYDYHETNNVLVIIKPGKNYKINWKDSSRQETVGTQGIIWSRCS